MAMNNGAGLNLPAPFHTVWRYMATQQDDSNKDLDKIFNRLRARLFNMLEQMNLEKDQLEACKKNVRSITSSAWTDITNLID
jgi:hypothetical protein